MSGRKGRGEKAGAPPTRGLCLALRPCEQAGMPHAPSAGEGPKAAGRMRRFGTDGSLRSAHVYDGGAVLPRERAPRPALESPTASSGKSGHVTPVGRQDGASRPRRQGSVPARCGAALPPARKTAGRARRPQASVGGACCLHVGYFQVSAAAAKPIGSL